MTSLTASVAAALLVVVLAAGSIWLEVRRSDRRRLPLRIAAALGASVALGLLLEPPRISAGRQSEVALLVTEGARPPDIRRVADSVRPAHIFRLGDSLSDLRTLRSRHPGIRRVVVAGWGVDSIDLRELRDVAVGFRPAPLPDAIREMEWPREVALGEDVVLRGRADPLMPIRFRTEWGTRDSVIADSAGGFVLRARPRATGFARLEVEAGGRRDTLATWVREAPPLALLVVRSAPSFETSRVRDWIAARGGTVLGRFEVSAGRARVDQINTALPAPRPVTSALLDSFDVLWIDARALQRLSRVEAGAVRAAADSGLGVLLEAKDLTAGRRFFGEPFPSIMPEPAARSASLRWADGHRSSGIPLVAGHISVPPGSRVLAADERGRVAVSWTSIGAGSVVTSLVSRPSRWLLEGERAAYDAYWSRILGAARRPRPRWEVAAEPFAGPHRPVVVRRVSADPIAAIVTGRSGSADTVYTATVAQGIVEGRFWPRVAGPHIIIGAGDSLGLDVMPASAWPGVRATVRYDATRRWAALQSTSAGAARETIVESPMPRRWLFAVLLACVSILWWERRNVQVRPSRKEGERTWPKPCPFFARFMKRDE